MEFKHKMARDAYEEIVDHGKGMENGIPADAFVGMCQVDKAKIALDGASAFSAIVSRAIEVAAKIEIECERLEVEKRRGEIPMTPGARRPE